MTTTHLSRPQRPQVRPTATRQQNQTRTAAPHAIAGNLALKARTGLNTAAGWRPSFQVVATRAQRKARPRVFYALVTMAVVFGIIVTQLLLSVAVSSGAYEIASLQMSNKELSRTYQTMTQDLDRLSSPQNLAANAEALGMVVNNTPVYLRISDGAVLGSPVPASADAGVIAGSAAGAIPNSLLSGVSLVTQAESEAKAEAAKKAAADAAKVSPVTDSVPGAAVPAGPVALTDGLPAVATH